MPRSMKIAVAQLTAALAGLFPIAFIATNFIDSQSLRIALCVLPFVAAIFTASAAAYRCRPTTAAPATETTENHNATPDA